MQIDIGANLQPAPQPTTRLCVAGFLLALAATFLGPATVRAQEEEKPAEEKTALDLLSGVEKALMESIAIGEKSVVAVARVRRSTPDVAVVASRTGGVFLPSSGLRGPDPTDPDFVPNDFGSGVVIDAKGLILTCQHLLSDDCDYYVTTSERRTYKAEIKAADPRADLAVLKIDAADLTPMPIGDASHVRKGQIVVMLGNPYAIARDGQASASWGIISNLARRAGPLMFAPNQPERPTLHHFGTLLHTDAKLNLGASGGALMNLKGEMIGIAVSQAAVVGYEQSAGYAIPADDTFHRVVEALQEGREVEYGFLGITPGNLSQAERLNNPHGARIDRVLRGTPAFGKLRLRDIITHIEGKPIQDAADMMLEVGRRPVASEVSLTVERPTFDGQFQKEEVRVELTKYPVMGRKIFEPSLPPWRGVTIEYPTAAIGSVKFPEFFGGDFPEQPCVVVLKVEQDSPAWKGGLRPGMLISHAAGKESPTPKAFNAAVQNKTGPVVLKLIPGSDDEPPQRTIDPK